MLKNKRSANYVKSMSLNTVPKQTYLYQRFMKDENGEPWSPSKQKQKDKMMANDLKKIINVD